MKKLPAAFIAFLFIMSFLRCRAKQAFEYVLLEQYQFEPATIRPGTEVKLLAFSGGRRNDKLFIYYYQFIVRDKETGDTLRILAPLISIDESTGLENKIYTTPLQYSIEKGITDAFYEPKDSTHNLALQTEEWEELAKTSTGDSAYTLERPLYQITRTQLVVVNKSFPMFENRHYKSAIGILNFKEMPW
jgi:hypothetical protein